MKRLRAKWRGLRTEEGKESLAGYGVLFACGALALMVAVILWRSARF